jgi:hypothetical protein
VAAIAFSHDTMRVMRQNLFWEFCQCCDEQPAVAPVEARMRNDMATKKNTLNSAVEEVLCAHEPDLPGRKAVVAPEIKASNLRRLRRIEGQIRGLQRKLKRIATAITRMLDDEHDESVTPGCCWFC